MPSHVGVFYLYLPIRNSIYQELEYFLWALATSKFPQAFRCDFFRLVNVAPGIPEAQSYLFIRYVETKQKQSNPNSSNVVISI